MLSNEIIVIDYGVGNLLSVQRGLEHCGAKVTLTSDPDRILSARRVVLPGVGAFSNGMLALKRLGLIPVIRELPKLKTPLLGICLGMQLMLDVSEEFGETEGLGLISGRVIPVPSQSLDGTQHKIPHTGWSGLQMSQVPNGWEKTLMRNNIVGEAAYFVHSYMAIPTDASNRIAECVYGGHLIAATIVRDQITGCQFHPEKSGEVGLKILRQFCSD